MKKEVLGIKIDDINIDQAMEMVKGWLSKPYKHYIVTPNPELIMLAKEDEELKNIINNADLAIPDGKGLKLSGDIVCTISGIDLMEQLIKESNDYGFTVGLLGGSPRVAEKTAECLRKKYPKLKITFAQSGGKVSQDGRLLKSPRKLKLLNCDLLFVAFGQPKQEKWIAKNIKKIPVKVMMGVGGSFDYLSGRIPRAPIWVRDLGFEWLFRLILQPWRLKRQLSLVKYLILILLRG